MAEELRELRLSKQKPAKDMVAVVQAIYPKYDKTVQSKCENGDAYGVSLRPDAMAALYAHFAPELAEDVVEFVRRCIYFLFQCNHLNIMNFLHIYYYIPDMWLSQCFLFCFTTILQIYFLHMDNL